MVKFLPKLIEDRDKNVREETKQLIIEIYRWIGPAIKAKLTDLKPVQVFCFCPKMSEVVWKSHINTRLGVVLLPLCHSDFLSVELIRHHKSY